MGAIIIYPRNSGISIRPVENLTTINGQRQSFGKSYLVTIPSRLTGGARLRRQFDSEQAAKDFAREQHAGTTVLGTRFLEIDSRERQEAVAALDLLRPLKLSILEVATHYVEAYKKLGGRPLLEAVNDFVKRRPAGMPIKTVSEVFAEFIAAKRNDGASAVYLKDLEVRIGKFAESFENQIAEVTATSLNKWLRALKCGPRARNNYRRAIKTLFAFAEAQDYLTKDHVEFSKVAKATEATNEIEVFTTSEMVKLLNAAQFNPENLPNGMNKRYAGPGLLPLLLLGGFAGLRTNEVQRQRWEDIKLERGVIRVTAAKGNTAQKRLIPIAANLKAWLAPLRRESGLVLEIARPADAIARLAERAGVSWKHNALRHSFISYRVAETSNVAQTSLESGNSPKMIFKHYREVVEPDEAKAWFSIMPHPAAENVTTLESAVA